MRILVLGHSGSGKSTLARALSRPPRAPVLHLDTVHWLPGWRERDHDRQHALLQHYLNTHAEWVIDGNYFQLLFERRLELSDLIVILLFPRRVCLYRALKRRWKYRGKSRESMTEGCPERLDWNFIKWILVDGRSKERCGRFAEIESLYPERVIVLRNARHVRAFMDSISDRDQS
jgi:adenylate kinase family enzyme